MVSIALAIVKVPNIPKLNYWKYEQNRAHFVRISNGFGPIAAILSTIQNLTSFKMWTHLTIWIPNTFGIRAPTACSLVFPSIFLWQSLLTNPPNLEGLVLHAWPSGRSICSVGQPPPPWQSRLVSGQTWFPAKRKNAKNKFERRKKIASTKSSNLNTLNPRYRMFPMWDAF